MGWIKVAGKVLTYTGKLMQAEGFEEWCKTQGKEIVEKVAEQKAFKVLKGGKMRQARAEVWGNLKSVVENPKVSAALQRQTKYYQDLPGHIATDATGLPSAGIVFNEVRLVPVFLMNDRALQNARVRLGDSRALKSVLGGDALLEWFFQEFVSACEAALRDTKPSVRRSWPTLGRWTIVGADHEFVWKRSAVPGHFVVAETLPGSNQVERRNRANVEASLEALAVALGRASEADVQATIRKIRL